MATLNAKETDMLGEAMKILSTIRASLQEMTEGKPGDHERLKWLEREAKKAYDNVHTIRTMKGHYPK